MSALGDRAAIALALECASRLAHPPATVDGGGIIVCSVQTLLSDADAILAWMDSRAKARAKADPIRTPNYVLPEEFTHA